MTHKIENSIHICFASKEEAELIDNKLVEYNNSKVSFTRKDIVVKKNYVIKDEAGVIIAGINSYIYCWDILYIDILYVEEE